MLQLYLIIIWDEIIYVIHYILFKTWKLNGILKKCYLKIILWI